MRCISPVFSCLWRMMSLSTEKSERDWQATWLSARSYAACFGVLCVDMCVRVRMCACVCLLGICYQAHFSYLHSTAATWGAHTVFTETVVHSRSTCVYHHATTKSTIASHIYISLTDARVCVCVCVCVKIYMRFRSLTCVLIACCVYYMTYLHMSPCSPNQDRRRASRWPRQTLIWRSRSFVRAHAHLLDTHSLLQRHVNCRTDPTRQRGSQ